MENISRLKSIDEYNRILGTRTQHPLVSVADFSEIERIPHVCKEFSFYCIFFKELECGTFQYGRSQYDYQEGTLLFISPGQIAGVNDGGYTYNPKGLALMFHPDFLYGTPLANRMKDYSFFSYASNEALHMSDREKEIITGCFKQIREELDHTIDKHTKQIISSYIESMLNHCERFYDRQFITREISNRSVISKFERYISDYFNSALPASDGIPSVQQCAAHVCLSPNYFGDLIKRETGITPQEYIHKYIISLAKHRLSEGELNVSEIAYELGFKYPHHLTRMFKKMTGMTPNEFRNSTFASES